MACVFIYSFTDTPSSAKSHKSRKSTESHKRNGKTARNVPEKRRISWAGKHLIRLCRKKLINKNLQIELF